MKGVKKATFLLVIGALAATLYIGFMNMEVSSGAVSFLAWSVSPYICLLVILCLVKTKMAVVASLVLSIFLSVFGVVLLIDALYIHLDAQSGLVMLFAPLWQWVGLLLAGIPLFLLNKVKNA